MNVILIRRGYPLVVILKNDRKRYYDALRQADKGDYYKLVRFIAQAVERSLDIYLKILIPKTAKNKKFLPISKIAPETPYSAEYLSLLARQGKLEAHKEQRNWLTNIEAVQKYIDSRKRERKFSYPKFSK